MLHRNIENLMAAKAVRGGKRESGLKLKDMQRRGEKQLKVEQSKTKKRNRSDEEKQIRQLQKAAKRLQK